MNPEVTKLEIEYLKLATQKLSADILALTKTVNEMNDQLLVIRTGRKWFMTMLGGAAVAGALIDTLLKAFKVY